MKERKGDILLIVLLGDMETQVSKTEFCFIHLLT